MIQSTNCNSSQFGEQIEHKARQELVLVRVFIFIFLLSSVRFFVFGDRVEILIYCIFAFSLSWVLLLCLRSRKTHNNVLSSPRSVNQACCHWQHCGRRPISSLNSRCHFQQQQNQQNLSEIIDSNNAMLTVITIMDSPSQQSPARNLNEIEGDSTLDDSNIRVSPPSYDDAIKLPKTEINLRVEMPTEDSNESPPPPYEDITPTIE